MSDIRHGELRHVNLYSCYVGVGGGGGKRKETLLFFLLKHKYIMGLVD